MATGDRGGLVDQRLVGTAGRGVGTEHGMGGPVVPHRAAVVGEAGLDPLDPVHVGPLARQGREHPGPGRDAGVLIGRAEQGEAVALDGQHGGGRPGAVRRCTAPTWPADAAGPNGRLSRTAPPNTDRLAPGRLREATPAP